MPVTDWTDADLAAAAALRDRALKGTSAYEHVSSLVTEVGPRLAGSAGDEAAVRWAMNRLGKLGFTGVRTQDVLVPRWIRGTTEVTLLGPAPQPLVAATLGGSIGTAEEGIEAGVIEFDSLASLSTGQASDIKNKIVFINERMERTRDGEGYGKVVKNRVQGASVAANLGAVAVVIRSVGTSDERFAHTGRMVYDVSAPRIPAFSLSNPDADVLSRQLKTNKQTRLRVKSSAREMPSTWSANVIGEIPGTDRAGEIVLLGAHLDSWDLGQGALDDGAGVAIVVEAARLISRMDRKPSRTVRVVLFANEEFGLSGAKEYARLIGEEHAKHVLAMEADTGIGPVIRLETQVAPESLGAIEKMRKAMEPLVIDSGVNTASGGADLGPLRALGVPVLDPVLDATLYFDVHHTMNDTLAKVDAKTLDQTVAAYAVAAYLAATKQGDFGRLSPVPFDR
ncbi:M20/M25/M40 family metallo-hydrolase [Steroidobacter sp.]|uniref:M20/M25/M40 family metallo-hydrolase n=1 Tax=Steroidobacter sp. TaxID=1978227 RepID=UPI001A533A6B|nr:M20/M25/M40 family metallo-hydrolase [Steroidobacter sp.]MBL8271809.1 M20/M25/M40 family metallo-hydrolase [Steroidobacter sp.]